MLYAIKRPLLAANGARRLPVGIGRGIRLNVDFAHHTRLYAGLYEIELNRSLRNLCPPGSRCFDVGAHFGYDTLVLAKLCKSQVTAFECEPALANRMRANLALNPDLAVHVRVAIAYVGASTDPARGCVTLDDTAFEENGFIPDFVKVDVEGAEAEVLEGSQRLLAEHRPSLIIETHAPDVERQCQDILHGHGYSLSIVDRRRWIRDRRPIAHNRWIVASPVPRSTRS